MKGFRFKGIGIIGFGAILYMGFSHIGLTEVENELIIHNVEALTQSDTNPNIMYGYQMNQCYEKEKIGHQTCQKLVGAKCEPIYGGECKRTMQWGTCP